MGAAVEARTEGARRGRPAIAPRAVSLAERLAMVEAGVQELLAAQRAESTREEAFRRFQTTGPLALPMSTPQVAAVLDTTPHAVHSLVNKRRLVRRLASLAGFHPDDVRSYLNGKASDGRGGEGAGSAGGVDAVECEAGGGLPGAGGVLRGAGGDVRGGAAVGSGSVERRAQGSPGGE